MPQLEDKVLHVHPQRPRIAQRNNQHDAAKVLKALGGAGVLEVIDNDADGTYRAVYIVRFPEAVFALHVFQKKSKHSIETPQADMAIIRQRLKVAAIVAQELKDGKARG
nr:type II toxin-antitoxin system RelE/ParE family toxin [Bordetella genomosp. 12]